MVCNLKKRAEAVLNSALAWMSSRDGSLGSGFFCQTNTAVITFCSPGDVVTTPGDCLSKIGAEIITKVLAGYSGSIAIRLWDGTLAYGALDVPCTVVFTEPGALRDLIFHRDGCAYWN